MAFFKKSDTTINVTNRTIVKFIIIAVVAFLLLRAVSMAAHELHLIFVAMFLAIGLNPAVTWISRRIKSKSRIRATGAAYVIVITLLVLFLSVVVPPLVKQTSQFVAGVPDSLNNLKYSDTAVSRTIRRYKLEHNIDELRRNYSEKFGKDLSKPIINTAGRVGGTLVSIITVLVLTFMMLVEGPLWFEKIIALQPPGLREKRRDIVRRMYRVVTGFFNNQVVLAFIAATFAAVALFILNMVFNASVNPIALSGIVFIFGLLPLIGNTIAATIVVLICLMSSLPLAIAMACYFVLYLQIENATLQPYIQSRTNQLTPLTVFIAALIGAGIGGILGALAAVPVAGCGKILLDEYIKTRYPDWHSLDLSEKRAANNKR